MLTLRRALAREPEQSSNRLIAKNDRKASMKNAYIVDRPDFELSPRTGMTRKHYIDCARYVLERAFRTHVKSFDQTIVFRRLPAANPIRSRTTRIGVIGRTSGKRSNGLSRWPVR